jgi:hypothetical protein
VLAYAKTEDGRDARGDALTSLVGRLSTYQLRTHDMLYAQGRKGLVGKDLNLGEQNVRRANALFMSLQDFISGMDFRSSEMADFSGVLSHVVHGLLHEGLIEDEFRYGGPADLGSVTSGPDFRPTRPFGRPACNHPGLFGAVSVVSAVRIPATRAAAQNESIGTVPTRRAALAGEASRHAHSVCPADSTSL